MVRTMAMLAALAMTALPAWADDAPVRIGVLEDMSGVFARISGPGSVVAARMAAADFGGKVLDAPSRSSPAITRTSPTSAWPWPGDGTTATCR